MSLATLEAKNHALIAPGQGNQTPGMGREIARAFPAARAVWRTADQTMEPVIHQKLTQIVWNGSSETLQATEICQPASIADSLARMKGLKSSGEFTGAEWHTGNSLGFVVALVTSGALALKYASQLGRGRGEAFGYARKVSLPTTMIALIGVSEDIIEEVRERFKLALCLQNPGNQNSLGGLVEDIRLAKLFLNEKRGLGDDKVVSMEGRVDAAFHSPWMEPAVPLYKAVVDSLPINKPEGKLVAGSTASVVETPEEIREALVLQLTRTERFTAAIRHMVDRGVSVMTELNGTPRLVAMLRREFPGSMTRKVAVQRNEREITLGFRWHSPDALPMMAGGSGETREEIFDWYRKWIADRVGEDIAEGLTEGSLFIEDATLDSTDLIALRAALINRFGRVVPDEEAKKNDTLGKAVEATYSLLNP